MGSGASKEAMRPSTAASQQQSTSSRTSTSSTTNTGSRPGMNGRTNSNFSQRSQSPPPPRPPTGLKVEVFNLDDYKYVHTHVMQAPTKLLTGTFRELVQYLTGNTEWSEMAKVRSIFLWLTSIDVYNLKVDGEPPKQSPMEYFSKIQNNQGNHAHLFSGLCQMANIPCMIISGMNKSAAYEIGKKVDRKSMGAQWNAVFINDSWRFVDAFWASACVVGRKSGEWALVDSDGKMEEEEDAIVAEGITEHRINEFYFLPDPDQLIWTHYPDEKPWQLLAKPVSVKEFEDHFYVRERFHILGMKTLPKSQLKCVVTTKDGEVAIPFQLPETNSEHYRFKYMLYKSRSMTESESKIDAFLDRFVFFEHGNQLVDFSLRFPVKGMFKLDVYGLDVRESDIFDLVCTYLIQCPTAKKNCLPLPDCPPLGWGPVGITKKAGLSPVTHDRALIETNDGKVEVRFKTDQKIKIQLTQNLKHAAIDDATLSKYAITRKEGDEAIVNLRLPQKGEYALKLYAQGESKAGEAPNVCNYLIRCTGVTNGGQPFPNFADGFLGKGPIADKLGVEAVSHPGGIIETKDGKVSVKFKAKNDIEMICEVHSNDPNALKKTAVATKNENGEWTFDIDMPKSGEYSLNVFARQKGNPSRIYNVHSYLVESMGRPGYNDNDDDEVDGNEVVIPTETVDTSDGVVMIPVPPGCKKAVAAVHRRNANDPPSSDQIEFVYQDDMDLVKVELKEYGEYVLNLYDIDENGSVKNVARYQINRKRPGDLYSTNLKTIMETMNEEGGGSTSNGRGPSVSPEDAEDEKQRRSENEKKQHAMKQLQRAMDLKDERQLEAAIQAYLQQNPDANDEILNKARRMLEVLKIKGELMEASQKRDLASLGKAIKRAKENNSDHQLDLQIAMASRLHEHLAKIEKLRHAVLNMQQTTVSELRNYSNPPDGVHQSLMATFLLLGHSMKELKVWRTIQALMGKTGKESMMRKVSNFKPKDVSLAVARSAKRILDPISKEHIRDVSAGAATFYVWSKGMIEEVESYGGSEASAAQNKLQYKE